MYFSVHLISAAAATSARGEGIAVVAIIRNSDSTAVIK